MSTFLINVSISTNINKKLYLSLNNLQTAASNSNASKNSSKTAASTSNASKSSSKTPASTSNAFKNSIKTPASTSNTSKTSASTSNTSKTPASNNSKLGGKSNGLSNIDLRSVLERITSATLQAIESIIPPQFCWKKGLDVGVIPTNCPKGMFRSALLCYENCENNYTFIVGVCWEICHKY